MATKRKAFYSHISDDNNKRSKKQKQTVEELVGNCYIKEIIELIEGRALMRCNSCECSFRQKMECFFTDVLIDLESDASGVVQKFEEVVKANNEEYYNPEDVANAKRMLECCVHRKLMVKENYLFFEEAVQGVKQ